jgi:ubiquinol-cytochrome c reductase cytochrome b subunit
MMTRTERIEVWAEFGGVWRWRYRATDDHTEIASNRSFDTLQEAIEAARLAYPGVPIEAPPRPQGPGGADLLRWTLYGLAALLVVAAVARVVRALLRRRSG